MQWSHFLVAAGGGAVLGVALVLWLVRVRGLVRRIKTSARLGQELGLDLRPEEVQYFLLLHEIGHTRGSGNTCLISAANQFGPSWRAPHSPEAEGDQQVARPGGKICR